LTLIFKKSHIKTHIIRYLSKMPNFKYKIGHMGIVHVIAKAHILKIYPEYDVTECDDFKF
jgi:hypothetical protein